MGGKEGVERERWGVGKWKKNKINEFLLCRVRHGAKRSGAESEQHCMN